MDNSKSDMKRLFSFLKPYSFKIFITLLLLIIATIFSLAPPYITKYAVDKYILMKQTDMLWLIGLLIFTFGILEGLIGFLQQYINEYIGHKVILDIRSKLFSHVNNLSFSYFDKVKTGEIMSRIISDTDMLNRFLGFGIVRIIANSCTIIGILIIMFYWNWKLGILFLCMIPFMIHGMYVYSTKVRPVYSKIRKKMGILTSDLQQSFSGIKTIKLFGQEKLVLKNFEKKNKSYFKSVIDANKITALWMPYVHFIMGLASGLVLWIGGILVINDEITTGILISFISYIAMLMRPIRQTGMMFNLYNQSKASSRRIFEILDTESEVKDLPDAVPLKKLEGQIEYRNVFFSYSDKNEILSDINFKVKPKQLVAFVGPSGAGKTTLFHLLPRFYDTNSGEILIDGVNIKKYILESLRQNIGIVMQNTFLFDGTIKDNITYGNPSADMSKIIWAAKIAQLDEFIDTLPLKYNTPIGERGVKLSGGQAQRLSLARVLVTDPSILLLDEPTSSVDAITDDKLMTALNEIMKSRTTFVIAHRLWTIKNADLVIVIYDGKIVGVGTHDELLKSNGYYNKLFNAQFMNLSNKEVE